MKALVVSNCATSAYVLGLKALFPEWEVRGAMSNLADQWVSLHPPKTEFIEYLQNCDLYVGIPTEGTRYGRYLSDHSRKVLIPHFDFRGLQPDAFHLFGFESVLKGGSLFSKIVVTSFAAGLTPVLTSKLFNAETYEAFGFFAFFDAEKRDLIERFQQHDIDLSGSFERWIAKGNFLYSYNHPRIDVLIEVLRRALVAADILPSAELERADDLRIVDNLREAVHWPVYPEIGNRHGLEGSLIWRRGRTNQYETLDLDEFITATFETLGARKLPVIPDLPDWLDRLRALT